MEEKRPGQQPDADDGTSDDKTAGRTTPPGASPTEEPGTREAPAVELEQDPNDRAE